MSTADPPISAAGVGLGYGIAIAVSILVLISTIMLASYACIRVKGGGGNHTRRSNASSSSSSSSDGGSSNIYRLSHSFAATGDSTGPMIMVGLDEPVIKSYPKIVLGESQRLPKPNNGPCSICLCDYQARDIIRCIPDCHHCFHAECVDEWLMMSATCPLCRNSPAPSAASTPIATPLSELVPFSFHPR
ncbi:putative RING-H2 finger protein ATL69 [Ricinus communis]|uniref:Ring finger protein, putative n=1 Tax=Ricinus communis TaxID=3988 RepID=B9SHS5_RICCO|nr:putative RING-H2 finger protein ATL69 [Ricinus communis]EEF36803.1 ring finger protein, putative [Ricinus communis]|eukprot:XP_002525544.1 putative RING-H2 finger protein ATL69 [Ricinus communis]